MLCAINVTIKDIGVVQNWCLALALYLRVGGPI